MRTFEQKAMNPCNPWEGVVSRAYTASMLEAGRDPVKELQTRQAKANGVANPIIVGAMSRPTRNRGTSFYRAEWDRLDGGTKQSIGGFDTFVSKRQAGLCTAQGQLTG